VTDFAPPSALRHGVARVGVSTLAAQWYCELKIDLAFRHPDVVERTPAMEAGALGHRELSADARPIPREALEAEIRAGRDIVLQESRFDGILDGVPVVGVPDLVDLQGRRCRFVLELKFSRRADLFIDRFVQAQTYALLLSQGGFETEGTVCVVGVVPTGRPESARRLRGLREEGVLDGILDRCRAVAAAMEADAGGLSSPQTVRHAGVTLQAFRFDRPQAVKHLAWALEYWRGRREPVPTPHAAKCRVCPFNAARLCPRPRAASAVAGRPPAAAPAPPRPRRWVRREDP
jgi:hypothetical protein